MNRRIVVLLIAVVGLGFVGVNRAEAESLPLKENLISKNALYPALPESDPRQCWRSWYITSRKQWEKTKYHYGIKDGIVKVTSDSDKRITSFQYRFDNVAIDGYRLSFKAKKTGSGKANVTILSGSSQCAVVDLSSCVNKWCEKELKFTMPKILDGVTVTGTLDIQTRGNGTSVEIKDLALEPVTSFKTANKNILLPTKTPVRGIYLSCEDPGKAFYDRKAAFFLAKWLKELTGTSLSIYEANGKIDPHGKILIGQLAERNNLITSEELSQVKDGGYYLKSAKEFLAIAGKDDGILAGVCELLKKNGVQFVSANEVVIAHKNNITLSELSLSCSPAFAARRMKDERWKLGFSDLKLFGNGRQLGINSADCHTLRMFEQRLDIDKHPERFAKDEKGNALKDHFGSQFCMSNSETRRITAGMLLDWMKAEPQAKYFNVSQNDGLLWCLCPQCKALDVTPQNMADRLFTFANHIAEIVGKVYPNKVVTTLSYTYLAEMPPEKVVPAKNIITEFCLYHPNWKCGIHAFCEQNQKGKRILDDWIKKYPQNLGVYVYPMCYPEPQCLFEPMYAMKDKIRYFSKNGVPFIYFCGAGAFYGPTFDYVIGKMLWNPDIDFEKTIDEHLKLYYGPAAPQMREFLNLVHQQIEKQGLHHCCELDNHNYVTDDFARKAYDIFDKALKVAGDDEVVKNRILKQKYYLLFTDLNERNRKIGNVTDFNGYAKRLAELISLSRQRLGSVRVRTGGLDIIKWLYATAVLKVDGLRDPKLDSFLKDPVNVLENSIPRQQEEVVTQWRIPVEGIYGHKKDGKYAILRRPIFSDRCSATAYLFLDNKPAKDLTLVINGKVETKKIPAVVTSMEIKVNNQLVYSGKAEIEQNGESEKFRIPASTLKKGRNLISIKNMTPEKDKESGQEKLAYIFDYDPYSGWIIISSLGFRR